MSKRLPERWCASFYVNQITPKKMTATNIGSPDSRVERGMSMKSQKTEERVETTERELLENSFRAVQGLVPYDLSRLEYLADYLFSFTTYDTEMGELFASRALEVCAAVSEGRTADYIKDADNYRWYLLMVNMPFFAGRLEWGTSIRGAWWVHEDQKLECCGIWRGNEQALSLTFTRDEWMRFIAALVEFANVKDVGGQGIPHDPTRTP